MRWFAVALLVASACAKEVVDPIAREVDFADPKSVLGGVFYAAASGDPGRLGELCDPQGESEPSVRQICQLTVRSPAWSSFRDNFRRARLNGEPRVSGNHADLNFVFGTDGTASETMELVRRRGRWYLLRF